MNSTVQILGKVSPEFATVLSPQALAFVKALHHEFEPSREELLKKRIERQAELDAGSLPDFLPATEAVRNKEWKVASTPADLLNRRVEVTGPANRKTMIDALNSGANTFKADLEDALSPTWTNVIQGQINLRDAVQRSLEYRSSNGKVYRLKNDIATLIIRPRALHLTEKHIVIDDQPISASLFDFGLFFFHNAQTLLEHGTGPYFYLPKLESHLEARLWNDIFNFAQDALSIPRGTIRATVLIESILAVFEMDEILYELKEHAAGLNAGRWDYIFSVVKKFRNQPAFVLPDRSQITMTVPFMRAYVELVIKTCHRRDAHAIGGTSAFIPNRKDPTLNEMALAEVRKDKGREVQAGFDGAWVAHPDLVPVVKEVFDQVLGDKLNQKDWLRDQLYITSQDLLDIRVPDGKITKVGLRNNLNISLQYMESWLRGRGAVVVNNLMEELATAETARTQIWQWIRHGAHLEDGEPVSETLYKQILSDELAKIGGVEIGRYRETVDVLNQVILNEEFIEYLTIPAYDYLD